jgi:hypothetical protein
MLDSGVFITAFFAPESPEAASVIKASEGLHKILICDFLREEVYAFLREKSPEKLTAAEEFFADLTADEIPSPDNDGTPPPVGTSHPIIKSAVSSRADVLVTSDIDFLESVVDFPKIMTAREFLRYR